MEKVIYVKFDNDNGRWTIKDTDGDVILTAQQREGLVSAHFLHEVIQYANLGYKIIAQ